MIRTGVLPTFTDGQARAMALFDCSEVAYLVPAVTKTERDLR